MPRRAIEKRPVKTRETSCARGYDRRWQNARAAFLASRPLCVVCEAAGIVTPATVVDHIERHQGDQRLFWDIDNWQPLCKVHHDEKTRKETGFGGTK